MASSVETPDFAKNIKFLGHTLQGDRADGMQLMVHKGYAYVSHMFSNGFTVIDVRDPRKPIPGKYYPAAPGTWNIHMQVGDDMLLVISAANLFAAIPNEADYYGQSFGEIFMKRPKDYEAGMRVYDLKDPANPREIGFMEVDGVGLHRIWYTGGRWAYASALLTGFTDYMFITIDMQDPAKPKLVGKWWIPGQNIAAGEKPSWDPLKWRYGHHHSVISGDTAYGAWRDGSLVILDVKDRANPELIVHKQWSPPFEGGTHSPLPIPNRNLLLVGDEGTMDDCQDGIKRIWVFDIRDPKNPISISTFPIPDEADYPKKGGHFGLHNFHENRPGSFVSDEIFFATYQNAGVRVFDIKNEFSPQEVGYWVPPTPEKMWDKRLNRPQVVQSADCFVDANGIIYMTDYNTGLYILQYEG